MNKIFKVIYNRAKHCYVVASEFAKSYSKGGGSRTLRRAAVALLAAAVYAVSGSALADNSGGTIDGDGDYVGNPTEYTVIIDSGFSGNVYGHKEDHHVEVKEASVTVKGGTVTGHVYAGYSNTGDAVSNTVTIEQSDSQNHTQIDWNVYGGYSWSGEAASNRVNISRTIAGEVFGGRSYSGLSASNSVNISSGGFVYDVVYGGYSQNDNAASNSVNISESDSQNPTWIGSFVYGGVASSTGSAYENKVSISGGKVECAVYGGWSNSGDAASNSVDISGDTTSILGNIYGGVASSTGYANYNQVNISSGSLKIVYGGYSEAGNAASNSINISGNSTKINEVYGGYAKSGTGSASYNIVNISGGTIKGYVRGGYANGSGDANENQVTMTGGEITQDGSIANSGNLYGGYSISGNSASNSVNISGDSTKISTIYGGYVNGGSGTACYNNVNISSGTIYSVYGGRSSAGSGAASYNNINISGGMIHSVYGGQSSSGSANSNSVNISGGTVSGGVYGGWSPSGSAASNSVNISGDTLSIDGNTCGGFANDAGNAYYNQVNISTGTLNIVYGGRSKKGSTASNSVTISGDSTEINSVYGGCVYHSSSTGSASYNLVTINEGKINESVYGGWANGSGDATSNSVNISGGNAYAVYGGYAAGSGNAASNSVNISGDSTQIEGNIYGGVASSTGYANYNQVNISTGTLKIVYGGYSKSGNTASNSVDVSGNSTKINEVYGGYVKTGTGSASYNLVTISDGNIGSIYGGYTESDDTSSFAAYNSVNVSGGSISSVYGGYSYKGSESRNSVIISGGTVGEMVYGAFSWEGNVENNNVTIKDATVGFNVIGAYSEEGTATNNSVTINGAEVGNQVYGGDSKKKDAVSNSLNIISGMVGAEVYGGYSGEGNALNNSVTISDGNVKDVFGGISRDVNASNNRVIIRGGSVKDVYGGFSGYGNVENNSVNINGGTFTSGSKIYGGYVVTPVNSIISNNSVNLSGTITGLDNSDIYGYYFEIDSVTHSGNELHLGRAVDLDDEGNIKHDTNGAIIYKANETTIWQGKTSDGTVINKVKQVANFETITLHSVEWSNSLPALAADSFTYDDSTALGGNVTLDITNLTINDANASGIMTLLQSDTDKNFSELKLKFSDSEAAVIPETGKVIKSTETNKTKENKGIAFTYDKTQSVFLADSDTKVNYVFIDTYKKSELGGMKWSEGGYSFSDNNAIDPSGLVVTFADDFNVEGAEDKNETDSIDLLDLSNVMGAGKIKEAVDRTKIVELQKDAASEMTFVINRSDSIKSDSQLKKIVYTVGKSTDVSKVVFKSSIDWNSETPYYNNSSFDFTNNSEIDASKLEFTFSNSQKAALSNSSAMTLVSNAVNQPGNVTITYKNNAAVHSQTIDYTLDNGNALSGTITGVVNTSNSAISFDVSKMVLNDINLADWDGKNTSEVPSGWTANDNGVNVSGVFADPSLSAGESKNILTASNAMFEDQNIDEAIRYAKNGTFENDSDKGVTLSGNKTGGVKASDDGKILTYYAMNKEVTGISLGSMDWGEGRSFSSNAIYDFKNVIEIDASELMFTNPEIMSGTMDIVDSAKNLKAGIAVTGSSHSQKFDSALDNKTVVYATLTGEVSVEAERVKYVTDGITINKFDIANWDGEKASSVNTSWKLTEGTTVETDGMSKLPDNEEEKQVFILKSDKEGYFANVAIKGENALTQKQFTDSDKSESVVLAGTQDLGVTVDSAKKNIVYKVGSKEVTSFKLNTIAWKDDEELLNRDKYNYSKLTTLDTENFNISYEKPETISVNQSMTLLKANDTLADMAAIEKSVNYQYEPVSGVTMDAVIRSSLEAKSGKVILTAASNKADKLTFANVDWMDKGALIDHKTMLNNVSFDGAAVDTTKIAFVNKEKLDADMQMTLVSDFGGTPGSITGSKYKVGTAYEGQGSAYMEGSDLVFKTKGVLEVSEETHTTVMGAEAGMAALAAGNDHISAAMEQLGMAANAGSDGVSTAASVGGGSSRNETGSHVDVNSWNITVAVGKNLEKKDGTFEYGLFGEYGRGNYTLHMDGVADAGSGNTKYTGGGLMAKFTNKHNVYTEASFRLGRMEDNASGILHDGAGNSYGYNEKAKYRGGHFGFGKICYEEDGTKLDVYSKFFYNQREGINFAAAGDQYSIDEVRSRVLRAGFRLSSTDRKWNRYGGISYDYEFGGQSNGTVNGNQIRAASIKGGTVRGELGIRREATKDNPWKTDISLFGSAGKRRGFGGSIAFEYHF